MRRLGARGLSLGWARVGEVGSDVLFAEEAALLGARASPKRVQELCAGRAAVRQALADAGLAPQPVLALAEGPHAGRPYLPGTPAWRVSVSHAAGLAVAAVAAGPGALGVDLEDAREERGRAFVEEAFADGELEAYAALPALPPVASAWALKEAVLKVWGVGLRAPLGLVRVVPGTWREEDGGWGARARLECLGALPAALPPPPTSLDVHLAALADGACVLALAGEG